MSERIFIKVFGFSDVERHALNTVFRLSEAGPVAYGLWEPDAPQPAALALVDGHSYEAPLELESPRNKGLAFFWMGERAPAQAQRVFSRPIAWPEVVQALDERFAAPTVLDFDLDAAEGPATLPPEPEVPARRALIASADRDERLYLRARLALERLTIADEAETAARALELVREHRYDVAIFSFDLEGMDGWALARQFRDAALPVRHVIATKAGASVGERLRARCLGGLCLLDKPPQPGALQALLQRI